MQCWHSRSLNCVWIWNWKLSFSLLDFEIRWQKAKRCVCVGWWGYQTNKDRNREGGEGRIALVIMQTISQSSWRKTYRASTKSAMQINILFALSRFSIRCFRRSSKHVRRSVTASFCRRRKRFRATRAPRWGSSSRSRTSVDHVSWTLLSEVKCQ